MGSPEDDANVYNKRLEQGDIFVAVIAGARAAEACEILRGGDRLAAALGRQAQLAAGAASAACEAVVIVGIPVFRAPAALKHAALSKNEDGEQRQEYLSDGEDPPSVRMINSGYVRKVQPPQ